MSATQETIALLIPAYRPDADLVPLVRAIRTEAAPDLVLVVDDGSGSGPGPEQGLDEGEYDAIFTALEADGARVIRERTNRGKGSALKRGLGAIQEILPGAAVITADADGQHTPADIARLAAVVRENAAWAGQAPLVLGTRTFGAGTPMRSRVGNAVSSALFFLSTGRWLGDTQTGLRAIPSALIPLLLQVPGDRYEYELSALLAVARTGQEWETMSIDTVYIEDNRSSHFRPLRDSARVLGPMLGFALSGLLAFAIDTVLFLALAALTSQVWLALLIARIVSGGVNVTVNRVFVFRPRGVPWVRTLVDYAALAVVLLVAGMISVNILVFAGVGLLAAKILTDAGLWVASFVVQRALARRPRGGGVPGPSSPGPLVSDRAAPRRRDQAASVPPVIPAAR